ncbi:primosomal protein N' [Eoetvoesiella caeni]|uniref:Replication restart protein PriA n=1 Tax=Eoetvoesiella caeni TaxID=645616 RepID=A0A366HCT1_9BURK|nr:primosomal protein N' [Eoetvoesiella caeni]MCI2808921.1 primosomal protein N' [Eoetvoesiella caeni]NYT55578.1 primosomal protein N' [Eoetvoesiella caeni]RBP40134.1 replication restart DNA helicase PriA [Eoetvoesiella caeni]
MIDTLNSDPPSSEPQASSDDCFWLRVAIDVPLAGLFDYRCAHAVAPGCRVIVPFGRRKLMGIVVETPDTPSFEAKQVREVDEVLDDLPPFPSDWMRMAAFAAQYYQRPLGEVMLPTLPAGLRKVTAYQGKRSAGGPVRRLDKRASKSSPKPIQAKEAPALNEEQIQAVQAIDAITGYKAVLLHGVTGSGKTEVYLRAAQTVLARGRQVLFMVPEINLTPQLEQSLRSSLAVAAGPDSLAVLHSGLSDGERLRAWLRVQRGEARILLGTRLSIFTPMPDLGLIIVDEEHDTSYKQQEGLRYSARDLAVWRAHDRDIPVVLGSATPSLESWAHAQRGNYLKLSLEHRARDVELPVVQLVDTRRLAMQQGFSPQLIEAIQGRLEHGEQSLVFLNRRGYAPVLNCGSCGWVSQCPRCTAYTVLHRAGARRNYLQCHHCGYQARVPASCPDCGDQDLHPMGRGTQRVEEYLAELFPEARIARIDADSTRLKGSAEALFAKVHAGEIDILVGTQMVAKGHDFANLGLVGVLNADGMLFAQDFRAPERLFAQLMQVAGRAGRHVRGGKVIIQTDYPEQPVYQALVKHDYVGFARYGLEEREAIGLPPYAFQALLTAEARELATAIEFLTQARALPEQSPDAYYMASAITLYDPVPLRVLRVANIERAQLLIESAQRPALQAFLAQWSVSLPELAGGHRVRWQLEVDPLEI